MLVNIGLGIGLLIGSIVGGLIIVLFVLLFQVDSGEAVFRKNWSDDKLKLNKGGIPYLIAYSLLIIQAIGLSTWGIVDLTVKKNSSYENHVCNILSLERDAGLEGHFTLGSGYVEGTQYYYFYTETNHGLKLEKASHEYTYLVETNDKVPCVYNWKEKGSWKHYYTIYIPEGTIIKEYKA